MISIRTHFPQGYVAALPMTVVFQLFKNTSTFRNNWNCFCLQTGCTVMAFILPRRGIKMELKARNTTHCNSSASGPVEMELLPSMPAVLCQHPKRESEYGCDTFQSPAERFCMAPAAASRVSGLVQSFSTGKYTRTMSACQSAHVALPGSRLDELHSIDMKQCHEINALTNLTEIQQINATKNYNAGAIVATPKRQLLCKNTSYDVQIFKIGSPVFCTTNHFANPQNPMLYKAYQSARRSLLSIPNRISIRSVVFAQLMAESPILYNV